MILLTHGRITHLAIGRNEPQLKVVCKSHPHPSIMASAYQSRTKSMEETTWK